MKKILLSLALLAFSNFANAQNSDSLQLEKLNTLATEVWKLLEPTFDECPTKACNFSISLTPKRKISGVVQTVPDICTTDSYEFDSETIKSITFNANGLVSYKKTAKKKKDWVSVDFPVTELESLLKDIKQRVENLLANK